MRLKDVASVNLRSLNESTRDDYTFKYIDISSVSFADGITLGDDIIFADAPSRARRVVKKGDVLISTVRTYLRAIADIDWDAENIIASTGFAVYTPNNKINTRFLAYAAKSTEVINQICANSKGVSYPAIQAPILSAVEIPYFDIKAQEAIAAYLDRECEKIGRQIELLERKADAYKRLLRSLINRAVTRGLAPNAPLKPSGLRRNSHIPQNWHVGRIRNYFDFRNEKVSEIDFAPLSVTKNGVVPQMDNVAKSMAEGNTRKKVCKDDFVVNSRSDRKGSCGTSPMDGSVSLIYIVLKPTQINPKFADYYFRCNDWVEEFYRNGKGIVADLWTTNYSIMRNIEIALPPYIEQQQIAAYLDEKCDKIDAIIEKISTQVERLKELKRSLINEVVTGKRATTTCKP